MPRWCGHERAYAGAVALHQGRSQSRDFQIVTVATGGFIAQASQEKVAALIAAVPDLLAALTAAANSLGAIAGLIDSYPRPSNDPNGRIFVDAVSHGNAACRAARAAIAKARP